MKNTKVNVIVEIKGLIGYGTKPEKKIMIMANIEDVKKYVKDFEEEEKEERRWWKDEDGTIGVFYEDWIHTFKIYKNIDVTNAFEITI
jgi:hypothetical protein